VPATREGLPVIKQLTSEGLNVNVTLLFGLPRYEQVAEAFLSGLEERAARGLPLNRVASVASFFLSRIDLKVDPRLEEIMAGEGPRAESAAHLRGEVAIASAKVARCKYYENLYGGERWRVLAAKGARPQRLLWASTSTKNPDYADVKYVEALIGPDTINTLPMKPSISGPASAPRLIGPWNWKGRGSQGGRMGIDLNRVTQELEDGGVKFNKPFDDLMYALETRDGGPDGKGGSPESFWAPMRLKSKKAEALVERFCSRLWRKDATLWTMIPRPQDIQEAMGWLRGRDEKNLEAGATREVRRAAAAGLHMGMGAAASQSLGGPSAPGKGLPHRSGHHRSGHHSD
jgi:transaldolase